MLKIGDFSKLSRVSIRMLRHYDDIGLIVPESIDEFTGYRYYSEAQLPLANRINALKDMGFSLTVIAEILNTYNDPSTLKTYLMLKRTELMEQAEKTSRQLLILEAAINRVGKDENVMDYSVNLKEMSQRYVASLRKTIPCYEKEGILWEQMMKELSLQNVQYANPCYPIAIFHDEGYKESDVDVEIQLSVQGIYTDTEHVVFKTVPAIQIASATFQGSYDQISQVNESVANWIKDNVYTFAGAMFNIYHVSPSMEQNPEKWVTEVCYPVIKK